MNSDNIVVLKGTNICIERGYYFYKNEKQALKLDSLKNREALTFLPQDIAELRDQTCDIDAAELKCKVVDDDAFSTAQKLSGHESEKNVLVLNFANAVNPGGGVQRGAKAQEEDLCRSSTLLKSLESDEARRYYSYNKTLNSYLGSDAVIVSPHVEVFRNRAGDFLEKSFEVSVITCPAPDLRRHGEIGKDEYLEMFTRRIEGVFLVAAYLGYKKLVLGAWGCGAFSNSPRLVSDMFYKTITEFKVFGNNISKAFAEIAFAVPYGRHDHSNFYEFNRNFCDFRIPRVFLHTADTKTEETSDKSKNHNEIEDRVRGCIIGGAAGDALGYPVEFLTNSGIKARYGKSGITKYSLNNGTALISDDTQMLLFTAQGVLEQGSPEQNIAKAYLDWYKTQTQKYTDIPEDEKTGLLGEEQLFSLRAPGNACMLALEKRKNGKLETSDFISEHINMSKGCGGIMRAAPCAFYIKPETEEAQKKIASLAAQSSAVTHGHPLGYMSSAMLAVIVAKCLVRTEESLKEIILSSLSMTEALFGNEDYYSELHQAVMNAVKLSENQKDDAVNLRKLGEGWVAEETLAVAVYCSLKYRDDFSKAIVAAVNHSGDSDSTGAVTGNIMGAYLGNALIEEKWKTNLELYDTICTIADKCAENIGVCCEQTLPKTIEDKSAHINVLMCAGNLAEADKICELASGICGDSKLVFAVYSPENDTKERIERFGFSVRYSNNSEYGVQSDYAADLIPLITDVIKEEKPETVIYVSGSECGFASAMAATNEGVKSIALSAGIRFNPSDKETFMRSACDCSSVWRVAADENAVNVLLSEGCDKESIIFNCDIIEKIKEIMK